MRTDGDLRNMRILVRVEAGLPDDGYSAGQATADAVFLVQVNTELRKYRTGHESPESQPGLHDPQADEGYFLAQPCPSAGWASICQFAGRAVLACSRLATHFRAKVTLAEFLDALAWRETQGERSPLAPAQPPVMTGLLDAITGLSPGTRKNIEHLALRDLAATQGVNAARVLEIAQGLGWEQLGRETVDLTTDQPTPVVAGRTGSSATAAILQASRDACDTLREAGLLRDQWPVASEDLFAAWAWAEPRLAGRSPEGKDAEPVVAQLELEIARLLRAKDKEKPEDFSAYRPMKEFLDAKLFPDYAAIHRALEANPWIRHHQKSRRRHVIHAGDWAKMLEQIKGDRDEDVIDAAEQREIKKHIEETRQEKQRRRKANGEK